MVNLESDTPYFYWTFNRIGDLEQGQIEYGFDGAVWKADAISGYSIGEGYVTFDSPAKWAEGSPVTLHRTAHGRYEYRSKEMFFDAVRADTLTHVVLTGKWSETDSGSGVFVAVLPLKQDVKVLLETAATVPLESVVPVLASYR
jgi:hypothetical protein